MSLASLASFGIWLTVAASLSGRPASLMLAIAATGICIAIAVSDYLRSEA